MNDSNKWRTLLLIPLTVAGCTQSEGPETAGPPQVYTTFYPTTYFAQRIAGDHAKVVCPVPVHADPIFWMPPPKTIERYQQADLIVINGAGFEKWVGKVSLPASKVVDTAKPFEDRFLEFEGAVTHSHGTGGQHSHEGIDGHTWLDPKLAKVQAGEIRKALARLLPEQADEFQAGYAALAADLDELERLLSELSDELEEEPLLASHPAYNYLAQRYNWDITNLDLDPEEMPDDDTLADIRQKLDAKPAKVILWESRPTHEIAERLKQEFELTSIVFSPCEVLGAGQHYFTVMKENISRLREALAQ